MLMEERNQLFVASEEDLRIYRMFLPSKHPLLDALRLIPWESFVPDLEKFYSRDRGQPAIMPLLMFKLEFLRYFCRLSDRDVMERTQTDVIFRWFLGIPISGKLPDASSLTRFRGRLGAEGFKSLFDRLVSYAREAHLIRDRLRLKDASHVIANIAVPTTLRLLAQLRERMLQAIEPLDPVAALGFKIEAERLHEETKEEDDAVRLQTRLQLVQDILYWIEHQEAPLLAEKDQRWQKLQAMRTLAEKIIDDCLHPQQGDRTLSVIDPDARRGKHGEYYKGYLLDIMIDAESQLITQVEVLPANGDEAKDAVHLVSLEHETHGNQIEQLSIDGIGFNGEMLRALESPGGLGVEVLTPPRDFAKGDKFPSSKFELSADGMRVTCPAGKESSYRNTGVRNGVTYQFKRSDCLGCPLLAECNPTMKPTSQFGRSVSKNEYEAEYERAREKATTETYQEVRRQHPAIERKLNEIMRHARGRRARYWGRAKVKIQECMTCFIVNVKRICRLQEEELCANL